MKPVAALAIAMAFLASCPASADEPGCSGSPIEAAQAFDPARELPGSPAEKATLGEHQILNVRTYRPVVANSVEATGAPAGAKLAMFLDGDPSPGSAVVQTVVEFVNGAGMRPAQYVPARKAILIFLDAEKYLPLKHALQTCAPVYSQFRRYDNGHIFADVHVGAVPTGR